VGHTNRTAVHDSDRLRVPPSAAVRWRGRVALLVAQRRSNQTPTRQALRTGPVQAFGFLQLIPRFCSFGTACSQRLRSSIRARTTGENPCWPLAAAEGGAHLRPLRCLCRIVSIPLMFASGGCGHVLLGELGDSVFAAYMYWCCDFVHSS
jgi:hypothetical protein